MAETVPSPADPRNRVVTVPNLLTLLRLLLIPVFLFASFRAEYTLAFALFVTAALTDIVDGSIARAFDQRSRLGALFDPAVDKTMMICGYLFYTFSGEVATRLPAWLTFVIFARDALIVLFAYLLYTRIHIRRFPPSIAGKISTLLQATALATTVAVNSFLPNLMWLAELLWRAALLLTLVSGLDYLRRANLMLERAEVPVAGSG
jgi:cardiolipin synthase